MQKKLIKNVVFILFSILIIYCMINIPYNYLFNYDEFIIMDKNQFYKLNKNNNLLIKTSKKVVAYGDNDKKEYEYYDVDFKLFDLIDIKKVKVKLSEENVYLAGGNCVGINLKSKGVVVVGSNYVITKNGSQNPFKESGLVVGDVITHLDGVEINTAKDISALLSKYNKKNSNDILGIDVLRKDQKMFLNIKPAHDIQTDRKMLGLWIRDDALGVGTVTFINNSTNRYGALGHAIIDGDTGVRFNISGGDLYKCNVVGVKAGKRGSAGELMGLFLQGDKNKIGSVDKNIDSGIYGFIEDDEYKEKFKEYEIGGREFARPGKAKILTTISGNEIKEYDIEIIKTNYQTRANEKSMVIKVTDKELIEKTGGIVQGMSGSPIIQNGKIIGAVTHVFINDPTKGFGLYLDWMISE